MPAEFIHLRVHSEYSLIDGIVRIKPLVKRVVEQGMPAVAITDQNNFFALVKFYCAAEAAGIKPILGADVYVHNPDNVDRPFRLTLLVQNAAGYRNLTELISKAYQQGQRLGVPILQTDWIMSQHEGLIALSGAREGQVGQALLADNLVLAKALIQQWSATFANRFYLELQRTGRSQEELYIQRVIACADELNLPVVATNDVRFLQADEFEAHEARVCINQGYVLDDTRRSKNYSEQQYLRTPAEMIKLFADIPEALQNTVEIAKRCTMELTLGKNYLPDFPVPEGMSIDDYFADLSRQGLQDRLLRNPPVGSGTDEENLAAYQQRLHIELEVIQNMGFPGYFLIVADFIRWAKENDIPVGPGRGSGAGSLVAYVLQITDLDPIEYDLLFERFLNPERVSMPDFDIDFCMDKRDLVIDYVARHYGRDKVSQIITYGTMAAKAVVRDVGRVLGHGYGFVDRLAKLIPFEIGMTLEKALIDSEDLRILYESDEEVQTLIDLARSLEGVAKNAGKHAGGVVIAPSKLTDFSPLYCEEGSEQVVTQYDKNDVEAVGLVKFDFLGLRTLTIIDWALKTINAQKQVQGEARVDITRIAKDDVKTIQLLLSGETTAVFQLESRGMKDLIRKLKPDCFEDVIALVALFRPGPLQSGMVDDYIAVKHGRKAEYAHPVLIPILTPTNGVILYQEQVMQIAREMAGYSLGGADLLRRAMGKKKPEEMAKQREIFTTGSVEQGVEADIATYVFDLMEKFAGYGFNKSHSAAYALVSYQTAWLKAHYQAPFMAAVLSSDMDNTDKVIIFVDEVSSMGLVLQPPDINRSQYMFTVDKEERIIYGLGAIKGIGQAAISDIIAEREQTGNFQSLYDLCVRIDSRKANKRVLEALVRSGTFDQLDNNRAALMASIPAAMQMAAQHHKTQGNGQGDFFGLTEKGVTEPKDKAQIQLETWSERRRLIEEKAALGLYLTGHPVKQYEAELSHFTSGSVNGLLTRGPGKNARTIIAGLPVEIRIRQTKTGKRWASVVVDDRSGRMDLTLYNQVYEQYQEVLVKDQLLVAEGELKHSEYSGSYELIVERLFSIASARAYFAKNLLLNWPQSLDDSIALVTTLEDVINPYRGGLCPVCIDYKGASSETRVVLGEDWKIHVEDELLDLLRKQFGIEQVWVNYSNG